MREPETEFEARQPLSCGADTAKGERTMVSSLAGAAESGVFCAVRTELVKATSTAVNRAGSDFFMVVLGGTAVAGGVFAGDCGVRSRLITIRHRKHYYGCRAKIHRR